MLGVFALLLVAGCSSSGPDEAALVDVDPCDAVVDDVVAEVSNHLDTYGSMSIAEYLQADSGDELASYQVSLAALFAQQEAPIDQRCGVAQLERRLGLALAGVEADGPAARLILDSIRTGTEPAVRDVVIAPDDDVQTILASLAPGSSITFTEGVFQLDAPLVITGELAVLGAGIGRTVLQSDAEEAAIALFSDAAVTLSAFSLEVGRPGASGVVLIDAGLTMDQVAVSGARLANEDGGTGVLVAAETGSAPELEIRNSELRDNEVAGIAVSGATVLTVIESVIEANAGCGICFLDDATGEIRGAKITGNGVGVQTFDRAAPLVVDSEISDSTQAGMTVTEDAAPTIEATTFSGNEGVGIEVRDDARPSLGRVAITGSAVGVALDDRSQATVAAVNISSAEVGLQVGGNANPQIDSLLIDQASTAGVLIGDASTGTYGLVQIDLVGDAVGIVIGGTASPMWQALTSVGPGVAVSIGDEAVVGFDQLTVLDARIGLDVRGGASVAITELTVERAIEGGVVVSEQAELVIASATLTEVAAIGLQVGDTGQLAVDGLALVGADLGALVTDEATFRLRQAQLDDVSAGIEVSVAGVAELSQVTINAPRAIGVSLGGTGVSRLESSRIVDARRIGVQVVDEARPLIEGVFISGPLDPADATDTPVQIVGALFAGSGGGMFVDNELQGFPVAVQVGGTAAPLIEANRIDAGSQGGVGVLFGDEAAGAAIANTIRDQSIGVQISGFASVDVNDNDIESATAAGVLITAETSARLAGNQCRFEGPGIVLFDGVEPELGDNACQVIRAESSN